MQKKKMMAVLIGICLALGTLSGCGKTQKEASDGKKTLVIGDVSFNSANEEADINPHNTYAGWACIRYGIGETLVKYSDDMEIEPWLAKAWENVDPLTWKITLQDNVKFSSGRDMDAEAVKECLEHLLAVHDRAAADTKIASMEADGQVLTIKTSEPKPALLNYLGDPYACIIDVKAGFDNGIVSGTGPYIAVDLKTDDYLKLVKNDNYWNGDPKIDEITIKSITDGNTLAKALQADEVQAAYGMAYESYPLFEGDDYQFSRISTSRCFFAKMNFDENSVCADPAVRKAIAMGIDKESFVDTLLEGNGYVANGVFPDQTAFGGDKVTTESYDPKGAKKVLEDAGWVDTDGDGIREKDGKKLSFTITYPSTGVYDKVVLFFQDSMKKLGIEITTNPIDLMAFMQQVFTEGNYEITAYMSYWFPYDPYTFVANMYPSTDYTDASGIYSTDPQIAKALATMSEEEAKELIAGLYKTDDPDTVQNIFTTALNSANESSVVIPLNYRNEYAVFNNEVIESYTFNSIPNHVDVAAIKLK